LFSENQFCSLSVWDLVRLTPWVFWPEIFPRRSSPCLLIFFWDLSPRFVPQDWHKFFIDHCQGWKEGSYVCETVWIFSWVNTFPFDLKFVAFWTKFSGDSYVEFQEKKIFWENFSRIFVQTKAIIYQNLWNFALVSAIFILRPYGAEEIQTSTFICCLHPGKEAHP